MIFILACPAGFTFFDGGTTGTLLKDAYNASVYKCADDCIKQKDCGAFLHSVGKKSCKLVKETRPNSGKNDDFRFCSKLGKNIVVILKYVLTTLLRRKPMLIF